MTLFAADAFARNGPVDDHPSGWEIGCRPFGVGNGAPSGASSRGFGLAAPSARRREVEQGLWSPATSPSDPRGFVATELEHDDVGVLRFAEDRSFIDGTFRDVHAPVRGLPLTRDLDATIALRAVGSSSGDREIVGCRPDSSANGRKATAAVTRHG